MDYFFKFFALTPNDDGSTGRKDDYQLSDYIGRRWETADIFAQKIRGHWPIGNQLHWVKDVIFKEDKSAIADYSTTGIG